MSKQQIVLPCMQCLFPPTKGRGMQIFTYCRCFIEPTKAISFICPYGHVNKVASQTFPFDWLLRWAFIDFTEEDYAGAMQNFPAALERFFEFSYKVIQCTKGLSIDEINSLWKPLSQKSSKQRLAFVDAYQSAFNSSPFDDRTSQSMAKIRNDAAHRGIRNKKNTKEYGEFVIEVIHNTIENFLVHNMTDAKHKITTDQLGQFGPLTTTMYSEFVSWEYSDDKIKEIEKNLLDFSGQDPQAYAEMASEANKQQKRLSVNENRELILISQEDYEQINKDKKYRGRKTFEQYCEQATQGEQMFDRLHVFDVETINS